MLSALHVPSPLWGTDREAAKQSLSATISLLLRLVGRDPDPTRSRDHAVLSKFAELRLSTGQPAGLEALLHDLGESPVDAIGVIPLDEYISKHERQKLATALNTLLASPDVRVVAAWCRPRRRRVAQARRRWQDASSDPERGTSRRRGARTRPRARVNPMDLDYRALSNAGCWWIGRSQTDADRERVVEGLAGLDGGEGIDANALGESLKRLAPRWFVMRDVHRKPAMALVQTRWTFTWKHGPMTRTEIRVALLRPAALQGIDAPELHR